ncbi:hypothetical protein EUB08_20825, partial [Mycobacterium tuberculosis]
MRAGADAPDSGRVKESAPWSYDEAFCRNLGLISPTEQQRLRNSRVAIAGRPRPGTWCTSEGSSRDPSG